MRFNMPAGTNMLPTNFNSQTPYIPFNVGALSAMSNQQLEVSRSPRYCNMSVCRKRVWVFMSQIMGSVVLKYLDM